MSTEARDEYLEILTKPSSVELSESGISHSVRFTFLGVTLLIGGPFVSIIVHYAIGDPFSILLFMFSLLSGLILWFLGVLTVGDTLKVMRLKLAAHMLRSLSLHAVLAYDRGSSEAMKRVIKAEQEEKGFIVRAFRAIGVNVEQAFILGALQGAMRASEMPYIMVYRNGILDGASATLVSYVTAATIRSTTFIVALILLGLVMFIVSILADPILVYTTARTLRNHAKRENEIRRALGLAETPAEAPGIGGLIVSLLTLGLYLPVYARNLEKSITTHILTH